MNAEPNELHQLRKKRIQDDKDFTSSRISESTRYLGFGLAAVAMALLTSDAAFPKKLMAAHPTPVILAAALGCLTIFADYLHYLFGYLASDEAARNRDGDFGYLTQSIYYRARRWFFYSKQIFAALGFLFLITALLSALGL